MGDCGLRPGKEKDFLNTAEVSLPAPFDHIAGRERFTLTDEFKTWQDAHIRREMLAARH
jgi:hypothetical protein